jgi:HEAT repeat protein
MEKTVGIEKILEQIRDLDESQVTEEITEIARLLNHRSVEVRQEMIKALASAKTGESVMIERLKIEKNELVTTDLCDALGNQGSVAAVPTLRRIAQCDQSGLSRRYAVTALLDILWEKAIPFLKVLRETERSYRVRSSINFALFIAGDDASLSGMLDGLRSQDYIVRCSIANQLWSYRPQRYRSEILKALRAALDREWAIAPRGDLELAITELSRK